jgi:hypothetical protein
LSLKKTLSKRTFFALPILALVLLVNSGFAKVNIGNSLLIKDVFFHQLEDHFHEDANKFNFVSVDEVDLVFSEVEAETEVETKIKGIQLSNIHTEFLKTIVEVENNYFYSIQYCTNHKIPLYDLFCNWKLHIS